MPPLPWKRSQPLDPTSTYIVTVTKLPLRSRRHIPRVLGLTWQIVRELRRSDGLVGYALKADLLGKTFWTVSAWEHNTALAAFARSDVHRTAVTALRPQMDEPRIATFALYGSELPLPWREVARMLQSADNVPMPSGHRVTSDVGSSV